MSAAVLAVNAGVSRVRMALFAIGEGGRLGYAAGLSLEGIGTSPHFCACSANGAVLADRRWQPAEKPTHVDFCSAILEFAEHALGPDSLAVVGHLVLHGGTGHARATRATQALLDGLEQLVPLSPRQQPACLAPIRALMQLRPRLPQVACFDTAFHDSMPPAAMRLAVPREFHEAGVRRYGFHGLSYEYIAETLRQQAPGIAGGRVVVAHLDSEASLCALFGGKSIDVTTGFTALDGAVGATQGGGIDAGVVLYLLQQSGMTVPEVEHLLYHSSGLLGLSGISGSVITLAASGDPRATEAFSVYTLRVVREIGGLSAILDGLDGLVFTGSIGAQFPAVRKDICNRLRIPLDTARNERGLGKISAGDSSIEVWAIPTDEEAMIARHASICWMKEAAQPAPGRVRAKRQERTVPF
jgi:acetate kinase